MGSLREPTLVLVDSESDSDSAPHTKKQRLSETLSPFRKPYQESDSESLELALSDSDSELDEMSDPGTIAMKRTIYDTRKFLKDHGMIDFLREFLPETAAATDILGLIVKLGFLPRNFPPLLDGEHLLELIKLLNMAMKRVTQIRSRLENFYTVDLVLDRLRSAQRILVITGAGISTSLGIPDFRSSHGFYLKLSNLGLLDPQEVFDLQIFKADPSIFYSIAHMILPPDKVYAPLHKFIKLLQDKGKLLRNYTQNIDNLETNAGIKHKNMVQCHGLFAFASCVTCGYRTKGESIYGNMRSHKIAYCPKCSLLRRRIVAKEEGAADSYGVMKPDITFFGEALPARFHAHINEDLKKCDLVISIGTSLKVAPVAEIVDKVPANVPQILINRDALNHCNFDVSFLGYCDDVVAYLCDQLGKEWALDHKDYSDLVDDGNLSLEETEEKGVYKVINYKRELEELRKPKEPMPQPDLVVLQPTI